jgi:hypothetical protein
MEGHCLRDKAEKDHALGYDQLKRLSRVYEARLETMRLQLANVYEDK